MKKYSDKEMAIEIAKKVKEKGGRTFYVGGYVRDKFLGKDNKDIDIEIHEITPEELRNVLSELGTVTEMGASFGILGLKGYDIDIAQPRSEKDTGRGHRDFEIYVDPFIGYKQAAIRRDFTMNALMEDVLTGEVLDYFGGIEDLKTGTIKHVNDKTFVEDPLRVLRACQFAARFNMNLADETLELGQTMDLSTLPRERIYGELQKALLKSNHPSIFFENLRFMNQLNDWFPELKALIGCEQSLKWHPEGDVWNHTMLVLDYAAKLRDKAVYPEALMLAALCHDFGKPEATTNKDGKIQAIGHECKGIPIAEHFLDRVVHENDINKYVLNMVELHMKPNQYASPTLPHPKKKSTNALFDDSICPNDLLFLAKADHFGRGIQEEYSKQEDFLRERLDWYENNTKNMPQVTGTDLIELGLKPGPAFKKILNYTHNLWLCNIPKERALRQTIGEFHLNKKEADNENDYDEPELEDR